MKYILITFLGLSLSGCLTTAQWEELDRGLRASGQVLNNYNEQQYRNNQRHNQEATCQNMENGIVTYNRAWFRRNCY